MSEETQLDQLTRQVGTLLVETAKLTTTVEAMRSDITRSAAEVALDIADHERRLRDSVPVLIAHGAELSAVKHRLEEHRGRMDAQDVRDDRQDADLRELSKLRWLLTGAACALGAGGGAALTKILGG